MSNDPYDFTPFYKNCKRLNIPGHTHYLTCSCFRRQQFLSKDRTRHWLADAIIAARSTFQFKLIAYVFMPEHIHLLMHPTEDRYDISKILAAIKQPVARTARKFLEQSAPDFLERMRDTRPSGREVFRFWQRGGGYDRNLFSPEELWEKIHYLHNNPVRRKLVPRPTDWPWSSTAAYAKRRQGPLPVDNSNLPWTK